MMILILLDIKRQLRGKLSISHLMFQVLKGMTVLMFQKVRMMMILHMEPLRRQLGKLKRKFLQDILKIEN